MTRTESTLAAGARIGGYRVERVEPLPNLQGTYVELVHEATGARHVHVRCPDDNNGYAVTFPTVPRDSTGVAHILEHCTLSGSRRFPVKDPFFSMLPRSLNTFMNAMTSSDWTTYPFSTRNPKDFFNLLDVYLDATFFPLLTEDAFRQEGHRLEFEVPDDPSSPLRFKGVVFNEMKGAMSAAREVMELAIGQALMPDLTYANNSGGDPERMPDLTWDQLREFHATHYHPSNARFFTYGSLPLDDVLAAIEARALSSFERIQLDVAIPDQPRRTEPITVHRAYPIAPEEDPAKRSQVLVCWLTTRVMDSFELLSLRVLDHVLLDNPASPLHHALISSGLGDALADGTGLHAFSREAPFGAGLQGTEPEHADRIERIVVETLERLARDGVDAKLVDAAIHRLELESREVSNAGVPYFLKVLYEIVGPLVYGGDAYRALQFDADVERLRGEHATGGFFEALIRRYLLDNPHRARIVLTPDPELEPAKAARELERLAAIERTFEDDDRTRILQAAARLKTRQETKEDVSCLPTVELSDVPLELEDVSHAVEAVRGTSVGRFAQPTNGLSYVEVRADCSSLPDELFDLLPLFGYGFSLTAAGALDHLQMAERIAASTGGVHAQPLVRATLGAGIERSLRVAGKALSRNDRPFVEILRDLLSGVRFETGRLAEIVGELRASLEGAIERHATQMATTLAASRLVPAGVLQERLSGVSQLVMTRALSQREAAALRPVADKLEEIRDRVFRPDALRVCVTAPESSIDDLRAVLDDALATLPARPGDGARPEPSPAGVSHEARTASVAGAYNAKVLRTAGYGHPDAPVLAVLAEYLRSTYLHREVREAGGAYGAYARFDAERGLFALLSFRDPHIVRTFERFDEAIEVVRRGGLDATDVKEAILSASASLDPLLSPDTKGARRFYDDLAGYTLDRRASFRRAVLQVTPDDLVRVCGAQLAGADAAMATVANAAIVEEANRTMGGVFHVESI